MFRIKKRTLWTYFDNYFQTFFFVVSQYLHFLFLHNQQRGHFYRIVHTYHWIGSHFDKRKNFFKLFVSRSPVVPPAGIWGGGRVGHYVASSCGSMALFFKILLQWFSFNTLLLSSSFQPLNSHFFPRGMANAEQRNRKAALPDKKCLNSSSAAVDSGEGGIERLCFSLELEPYSAVLVWAPSVPAGCTWVTRSVGWVHSSGQTRRINPIFVSAKLTGCPLPQSGFLSLLGVEVPEGDGIAGAEGRLHLVRIPPIWPEEDYAVKDGLYIGHLIGPSLREYP